MRFIAVLNRDGGTLRTMDLEAFCVTARDAFEQQGHVIECRVVAGDAVEAALRKAAGDDAVDAIVAAGGDGTISTAAMVAFETGKPLAVLPAGTMNLFARALKVPLVLSDALEALAAGEVGSIDIATANDRAFVHQFSVGIHARLVRIRESMSYRGRIGKMLASLRAIAAAAMHPPSFDAELRTRTGMEKRRVSGIAVSNNPIGDRQIHADALDGGVLGVYVAKAMSSPALFQLAVEVFLGTWRDSPMVSENEATEVTLHFPKRKKGAQAVIDGELIRLDRSVTLRVHPRALKVIIPRIAESEQS